MVLKVVENQTESKLDWVKWSVAVLILLAGCVGNYYYSDVYMPIRMGIWLALLAIAGFIASRTLLGRKAVEFVRESRTELRKVVWPTRQEVVQTTMVVAAMVVVLAIILWGMDGVLVWLIGWLTGQHS